MNDSFFLLAAYVMLGVFLCERLNRVSCHINRITDGAPAFRSA